jgi:Spy/CpxP family protein refolding chaperone
MSLRSKFFSSVASAAAIAAFATFSLAQDSKPAPQMSGTEKAERQAGERGFGKRKFGGGEFAGRGGMRHPGMFRMMRMVHMMRMLNLTDAQREQIHSIMLANRPDRAVMEEARTLRIARHDGTITADQQARLEALRSQALERRRSVREQILAVLTSEQKAQLEQKKAEMKQRMEERRQKRQQTPATTDTTKVN